MLKPANSQSDIPALCPQAKTIPHRAHPGDPHLASIWYIQLTFSSTESTTPAPTPVATFSADPNEKDREPDVRLHDDQDEEDEGGDSAAKLKRAKEPVDDHHHHTVQERDFHLSDKIAHFILAKDETLNPNSKLVKTLKLVGRDVHADVMAPPPDATHSQALSAHKHPELMTPAEQVGLIVGVSTLCVVVVMALWGVSSLWEKRWRNRREAEIEMKKTPEC